MKRIEQDFHIAPQLFYDPGGSGPRTLPRPGAPGAPSTDAPGATYGPTTGGAPRVPPMPTQPPAPGYQWTTYWDTNADNGTGTFGAYRWEQVKISEGGSGGSGGYQPTGPLAITDIQPAGYGYVKVTYSDGSQSLEKDDSGSKPSYLSGDVPSGYVPIKDAAGNIVDYKEDRRVALSDQTPPGYKPVYNYKGDTVEWVEDKSYVNPYEYELDVGRLTEDRKRTETERQRLGLDRDRFGREIVVSDRDYARDVLEDDRNFAENSRQFDAELNERIAGRQQDLEELKIQEAGATGRAKMQIQAQMEQTRLQLESDLKIANITDARERFIAGMQDKTARRGQDVTQRGQEIDYMGQTRGQDVERELGLRNLGADYLKTVAEFTGKDPLRGAWYALGDEGTGITPQEGAFAAYNKLVPEIRPVGPAAPMPVTRIAANGLRPGQYRNENILVGDATGDPRAMEQVRTDSQGRLTRIIPSPGYGGYTRMAATGIAGRSTRGGAGKVSYGNNAAGRRAQAAAAAKAAAAARARTTRVGARPAVAAAPLVPVTPAAGSPPPVANVDEIRRTTEKIVADAFSGKPILQDPEYLKGRPVFGTELKDPKKMAADWWKVPESVRKVRYSGYGLRDMDLDEVDRRVKSVTPTGVPLGSWAQRAA